MGESVFCGGAWAQEGMLQTIREDVRGGGNNGSNDNSAPSSIERPKSQEPAGDNPWLDDPNHKDDDYWSWELGKIFGLAVMSPFIVPHALTGDDFSSLSGYHPFPYDETNIFNAKSISGADAKPVVYRFYVDYLDTFNELNSLNGRLLMETKTRFGVDTTWSHLEEKLAAGGYDRLDLGDCNLVFRFAQNERATFRAGVGFNWLNDTAGTEAGFNFTYGVDLFPVKPMILSTTLDCGTLGKVGLFRFRTTGGIVVRGVETYLGYEYSDIGRTQWNSFVAGLGFWF